MLNSYEIDMKYMPYTGTHYFPTLYAHFFFNLLASKLNIIGSDNGLAPDRHQAIIWTNAGIFLIVPKLQ